MLLGVYDTLALLTRMKEEGEGDTSEVTDEMLAWVSNPECCVQNVDDAE